MRSSTFNVCIVQHVNLLFIQMEQKQTCSLSRCALGSGATAEAVYACERERAKESIIIYWHSVNLLSRLKQIESHLCTANTYNYDSWMGIWIVQRVHFHVKYNAQYAHTHSLPFGECTNYSHMKYICIASRIMSINHRTIRPSRRTRREIVHCALWTLATGEYATYECQSMNKYFNSFWCDWNI